MSDQAGGGNRVEFGVSRSKRTHGLLIAGLLTVTGLIAIAGAGPSLPDGRLIGIVALALAAGVGFHVLRTTRDPGPGMVLDDEGIWFREWGLPVVPWHHIAGVRTTGRRIRPLLSIDLRDAEIFFARTGGLANKQRRTNPLVRDDRLIVPNGALDATLGDIAATIREHRNSSAGTI